MRRLKSLSGVPWCGRTECDRAAFKVKVNRANNAMQGLIVIQCDSLCANNFHTDITVLNRMLLSFFCSDSHPIRELRDIGLGSCP
uniref:Uncharacterized protein n=1 Tax=Anguilla anguilla TaxID=7936 RepID=A0A0E9SV28_ANGAN